MRISPVTFSRITTTRISRLFSNRRLIHSTPFKSIQNPNKTTALFDYSSHSEQDDVTVCPDGSVFIEYREGCTNQLKKDIQKAMYSAKPQFNTAISIHNCHTKKDAQAIRECFSDLDIEGVSGVNLTTGNYAILVPPPADKEHCRYIECKFLPEELGKPWGSSDTIHPGWPELQEGTWINWDGTIPYVKRCPTDSLSHFFQPFLSSAQRSRCFPYLVMDHTQPKTNSEMKDDIRAFIRGSFFVIEDAFAVNMYFQPGKPTGTAMTTRWEFSVDALYKNFDQLCKKGDSESDRGLLKATLTVLLFRLWFLLRQRNDVLSLLNCSATDEALSKSIDRFTSRYTPAQLCQLDNPVTLTVDDLCKFQDKANSKKGLVVQDRQHLVNCLHNVVKDLRKYPGEIVNLFEKTPMKSVIIALSQLQELDFEDQLYTKLEEYGEEIFQTMTYLSNNEVEKLFDSVKPVIQSADGTPLAQI